MRAHKQPSLLGVLAAVPWILRVIATIHIDLATHSTLALITMETRSSDGVDLMHLRSLDVERISLCHQGLPKHRVNRTN